MIGTAPPRIPEGLPPLKPPAAEMTSCGSNSKGMHQERHGDAWLHAQVIAHSVGTWNAFEFLMQARSQGLMPRHVFLSAMAAPDIPVEQRPWRQQRFLSEADFQASYPVASLLLFMFILAAKQTARV